MRLPGFVGPTYQSRSLDADAERTINFYPEQVESGKGVNELVLYTTPGMEVFASLSEKPNRALFSQSGRVFAVNGGGFYELNSDGTSTRYGSVLVDENPATISSNGEGGSQLFITSGKKGYIFNLSTNALVLISDEDFLANVVNSITGVQGVATMGAYVDGYFVVLDTAQNAFQISELVDGLVWSGLDVQQRNFGSDGIKAMIPDHRELWFLGEKTTEVWFNSGAESFPFQPITGTFIEQGIIAPFSVQRLDNSIFWLGGDERGHAVVYRAQGYTPIRVSTHAIEQAWGKYSTVTDAIAYTYQDQGHSFYGLYFPQADDTLFPTSWFYDVATSMWHERALWDPDQFTWRPHLSRSHAFGFEKHLVGDRQSGAIYHLSLNFFDEKVVFPG